MAPFSIRDRIAGWVSDEIASHPAAVSGEWGYEVAMTASKAIGGDSIGWVILVTLRSPLIGKDALGASTHAMVNVPSESAVRTAVDQAVSALRAKYDQTVTEAHETPAGRGALPVSMRGRLN